MSNEVVSQTPSGSLALPSSVMARLAQQAKDVAAKERPAIGKISLRAGVLSYGGNSMPGNKMDAIIIATGYRNVWYAGAFDPDNVVSPNCFALSLSDENMVPHANVIEPVNATCEGCKYNEWKSAGGNSKGKACKQTRRLVMLPGSVVTDANPGETIRSAELAVMDLPVTSVRNYSTFVNALAASAGVPPHAAICQISVVPDVKTQFKVKFQPMSVVPTEEILLAIESRLAGAETIAIEPFESSAVGGEELAAEKAAASQKKGKKF